MNLPSNLYAWYDQNAQTNYLYTDTPTLSAGINLYNNQAEDTGETVGFVHNDGKFEIYDKYEFFHNTASSTSGASNYNTTFTPKRNGYYKITLIGGGAAGYGCYISQDYTGDNPLYTSDYVYSGGSGGGLILEVYLQSSITYDVQVGRKGCFYKKKIGTLNYDYVEMIAGNSFISYTENDTTYSITASGATMGSKEQASCGGTTSISNGWNIRQTILNSNGNNGSVYISGSRGTGTTALEGGQSVISGTTYGQGADMPECHIEDSYTIMYKREVGIGGGYVCIELIDS